MFADKLLRKNKKIRQACKVEGKILSTFSLSLYIQKVFCGNDFYRRIIKAFSGISCNNIIKIFKIGAFHLESVFQVIPIVILTYSCIKFLSSGITIKKLHKFKINAFLSSTVLSFLKMKKMSERECAEI